MRTNLGSRWEGLSLFTIGFKKVFKNREKVTPTVVVYVQPSTSFDSSPLRSQMLSLMGEDPEIDVAFHPGVVRGIMNSGSQAIELELA